MDPIVSEKLHTILESKNGEKVLNIIQMAAYFAHEGIRSCVFAFVFPNPSELRDAIQFLQRLSLIELSDDESSFSIPCETRLKLREHLSKAGLEENALKRAVGLLNESKEVEYSHFQSVYISAKIHPSLIEDVCKLPGNVIFGMLGAEKFKEAYEFGTDCIQFLSRNLGEFHRVVTELKTFLTFALLMMMKPKDDAMSLKDIYKKRHQVSGKESYGALLKMITNAFENDLCDTSKCEARVREMIFLGKNASDISECCDFEKWVLYCEVLLRLRVIRKSMEILDELMERGKVLFGKEEVGLVTAAMHVKALGLIEVLKLREAMDLLKDIFEKRRDEFGPMNLKTLCIQIHIGKLLTMMKEYDVSIKLFEELAKSLRQVVGETHELNLMAKESMVEIYRQKGNMYEACELSSSLTDTLMSYYGAFHPKTYYCKFSLGEISLEMEKFNEARKIFKELLVIAEISSAPQEEIILLEMRYFTAVDVPTSYRIVSRHGNPEMVPFPTNEETAGPSGGHSTPVGHTSIAPGKRYKTRAAVCIADYTREKFTSFLVGKDINDGCKNLIGLIEELFLDVKNGRDIGTVHWRLNGLKSDDVITVTTAKNEENRTLLQEARKLNHLEMAEVLQKFTDEG